MQISESWVSSIAPNAQTIKNGLSLSAKLSSLSISPDDTLLSATCKGSGSETYSLSVDFFDSTSPVYSCTCPSRLIPCKHVIGLLLVYSKNPQNFNVAEHSSEILDRRLKTAAKSLAKTEKNNSVGLQKEKKPNFGLTAKKAASQSEGMVLAIKLTEVLVQRGLGSVTPKDVLMYRQQSSRLADYYLTGVQTAFNSILECISDNHRLNRSDMGEAIVKLTHFTACAKKTLPYFQLKSKEPEATFDPILESWSGYAWKLTELWNLGFKHENATLLQLAFDCHCNEASGEYEESGHWMELDSGSIFTTKNYRPIKALRFTKEEDSTADCLQTPCMYTYPLSNRARWENYTLRTPNMADFSRLLGFASEDYSVVISRAINHLKNPFEQSNPLAFLRFDEIYSSAKGLYVKDGASNIISIADNEQTNELFELLRTKSHEAVFIRITHDITRNTLSAIPLALVSLQGITRLSS